MLYPVLIGVCADVVLRGHIDRDIKPVSIFAVASLPLVVVSSVVLVVLFPSSLSKTNFDMNPRSSFNELNKSSL